MINKRRSQVFKENLTHLQLRLQLRRNSRVSLCFAALICGALVLAGCGKKEQLSAVPPPVVGTASQPAQPAPVGSGVATTGTPPPVAAASEGGADLRDLNHAYIRWVLQSHRHAKTFEEFVAGSGISVPPAPAGKRYAIDKAGFIALVNQ